MEMFEKVKRSRAEMKVVNAIIIKYESAINNYKEKDFLKCVDEFTECKQLLIPIYDMFPKCKVSYYLMKSNYKSRLYLNCIEELTGLDGLIENIDKRSELYIKAKTKIFLYRMLSNVILNNSKESINDVISAINYFKMPQFLAVNRAQMFWIFIKGFLGEAGLNKTKQFEQLKDRYDEMRQEAENNQINILIKDIYKSVMSTKTRKAMFDQFNFAFFYYKYNLTPENKVISFLEKNLPQYVKDNNLVKLKVRLEGYLHLIKVNFNDYWEKMTIRDLLNEQKFRLLSFETLFGNLCGGFNAIFKEFFIEKKDELNSNAFNTFKYLMTHSRHESTDELLIENDDNLNDLMKTDTIELTSDKSLIIKNARTIQNKYTISSRNDIHIRKSCTFVDPNFDFQKDIVVPENYHVDDNDENLHISKVKRNSVSKIPKDVLLDINSNKKDLKTMQNPNNSLAKTSNAFNQTRGNQYNYHHYIPRDKKLVLNQIQQQISTQNSAAVTKTVEKPPVLRNVNNFLFGTLMNQFIQTPLLKKTDMSSIKIPNYIKNYHSLTEKNTYPTFITENQDVFFTYENFMLIKNFYLFGVCDGHGKNGKKIAEAVSILFPSNLLYLIIDNNLIKRKENLNEIIISLFKMEERPEVKDINILKYLCTKLDIDFDKTSFVKQTFPLICNEINEAISRTNDDCQQRKKIDSDLSGCTLCSLMVYGKVLYAINVGDSRAILGSHIYDENRWITKELTNDHKPDDNLEAKRIALAGGRIAQMKNEQGVESGPFRVWFKNLDSAIPGLAISRTIGDYQAKRIGVIYEPNIYEYKLNKIDKIIIIATDGLWEYMTNQEVISICAEFYENKKQAEDASRELISRVRAIKLKKNKSFDDITCVVIFLDVKD